jgi:phosphomannomutase
LPEHLGALCANVRDVHADFGVAVDPDADRAAFVDARGVPLGEELSLALAARVVLAKHTGPVVTNLSTSSIMDAVCARAGVALHRTPVGEAHVVAGMRRVGAIVGGEGNGGVILPAAHYGRDGLVAVALVAQALAGGATLRELADELPRLAMVKTKLPRPDQPWERTATGLRAAFPEHAADVADGLRLSRDEEWVHVRPSGTEPVVRVIAEARDERRTLELIERARGVLAAAGREEA